MKKSSRVKRELKVVNPNAAGIDIGSRAHYVAVPEGRMSRAVESFGCVTAELERMAEWLQAARIETVALESTGVYWIPVAAVLEDHGMEVVLVDPRQLKNSKNRKTDVEDSSWIQQMHCFGLLSAAFRPTPEIQVLRDYERHRRSLVQDAARQINLMQKSLEQMNVQLHKELSDITGVSGLKILRAIARGVQDPSELASLAGGALRSTPEELRRALRGHYREQHVFGIAQALKTFDFIHERIRECDEVIEAVMRRLPSRGETPKVAPPGKRRKNQPHFHVAQELARVTGVDLTRIPGVSVLTSQTVVSECGVDLTAFPDEHHFASWMGLSPNNKKTGGRIFSSRTRRRPSAVATALRVAAQSLLRSKTPLGDRLRSFCARLGTPKAITAMAHLLARLVFRGLTRGQEYLDKGLAAFAAQTQANKIGALQRRAAYLGYRLTPVQETA